MWLTASKNLARKEVEIAKKLAKAMPNFKFVPRSARSLERICALAAQSGENALLVFAKEKNKDLKIRKFSHSGGGNEWNWEENSLILHNCEFAVLEGGKKGFENAQISVLAGGDGEKEMAKFFGFENSPPEEENEKMEIEIKGNRMKISMEGEVIAKMELEWDRL